MATQTDRVLIEIISSANLQGFEQAKTSMLGLNSQTAALAAGLGVAIYAGKSMVEITEKRQKADNDLAQAVKAQGDNLQEANMFLNDFIDTNSAYFSSQSEIVDSYAALERSGLSAHEVQLDMNRALDLAALKGISVSDATNLLIAAEHGRTRGLIDLGITTTKYTDAQGNVINQGRDMSKVMGEVDAKTAHGRDTLTQTSQATNKLNNDWQDIAKVAGPPLLGLVGGVADGADSIIKKLDALGKDKGWNDALSAGFGQLQTEATDFLIGLGQIIGDVEWLAGHAGSAWSTLTTPSNLGTRGHARQRAASGFEGMVTNPTMFLAGEAGPEHVSISPQGRGGATMVNHFHIGTLIGDGPSIDRFANEIARRLSYATGR